MAFCKPHRLQYRKLCPLELPRRPHSFGSRNPLLQHLRKEDEQGPAYHRRQFRRHMGFYPCDLESRQGLGRLWPIVPASNRCNDLLYRCKLRGQGESRGAYRRANQRIQSTGTISSNRSGLRSLNQTQRIARHGHSYPRGIQSKEARTPLKTSIT